MTTDSPATLQESRAQPKTSKKRGKQSGSAHAGKRGRGNRGGSPQGLRKALPSTASRRTDPAPVAEPIPVGRTVRVRKPSEKATNNAE